MKKYAIILCMLAGSLSVPKVIQASHAAGADISVTQVGALQYSVLLRFYRDCYGIAEPASAVINYNSNSLGLQGSVIANKVAVLPNGQAGGSPVPYNDCVNQTGLTVCEGGILWGVREWHYSAIVTLPVAAIDWTFDFTTCCRNSTLDNLDNPGGLSMYIYTTINNLGILSNSTPEFRTVPVYRFCVGNKLIYDQAAYDADGDSLVYSFAPCLMDDITVVPYLTPYNFNDPIASVNPPGVTLDPVTGEISFTGTLQMEGAVCLLVQEYRNGVYLSTVMRDIQFSVSGSCTLDYPYFKRDSIPQIAAKGVQAVCGDTAIVVGLTEEINVGSIAIDGSDIRALDAGGNPIPIFSVEPFNAHNSFTDSIRIYFNSPLSSGIQYLWTKTGNDNNTFYSRCGAAMNEFDTLIVYVPDSITSIGQPGSYNVTCGVAPFNIYLNEKISCSTIDINGSDFYLIDRSGIQIQPDSVYGVGCSPANPYVHEIRIVAPDSLPALLFPLYLVLVQGNDFNSLANRCQIFFKTDDTLAILHSAMSPSVSTGNDVNICEGDFTQIEVMCFCSATYSWTHDGLPTSFTASTITTGIAGMYVATVIDSSGCSGTDTVLVTVTDSLEAPIVVCEPGLNGDALFRWSAVAGAVGYEVSIDGGSSWNPTNSFSGPLSHQLSTIPAEFTVRATGSGPCFTGIKSADAPCFVVVPRVVTPNGDGLNESFVVGNLDHFPNNKLIVYNCLGVTMYEKQYYRNDWSPYYLPGGSYIYVLELDEVVFDRGVFLIVK